MSIQLSFGTAGIRAPMGPGSDRLNVATVTGVAHAVCSYLRDTFADATERGLCVAFDGRTDSDVFARTFIDVAREMGFHVRAFETPTPTPVLAYCTRSTHAIAGVMITASHNPPSDNGIKLYMHGGAQVLAPHDAAIAQRIASTQPGTAEHGNGAYQTMGTRELESYLDTITSLLPASTNPPPRFAYTALHGVGSNVTRRLLRRIGVDDFVEVQSQAEPQRDLGGLASPNPEHDAALAYVRALAEHEAVDLAFAHDPDADRLAVLVRDEGRLRALSGDEVGALLGDFLLETASCADVEGRRTLDREHALCVSTLVSGELLERVAQARGARFVRTPTGFKWIAARARELERTEGLTFVFGYEEAIGYAFGAIADDKDGIAALYVLIELSRRLRAQGKTLRDRLLELSREHGVFVSRQLTVPRGASGDLMTKLRASDPDALLGAGTQRTDFLLEPEHVDLLTFRTHEGHRVCVRPSGTEPKVKLYLHVGVRVDASLEDAQRAAANALDALTERARAL